MLTNKPNRRLRVLVVDDDSQSCRLLSMLLEQLGYETRFAHDGETGLVVCSVWKPDVVLLDLSMPWMDGVETARALRESRDCPRLVALTGSDDEESRERTRDAGFQRHLVKGCALPELLSAIEPNVPILPVVPV